MNKNWRVVRWFFALVFLISGVFHFIFPLIYRELMPDWVPNPEAAVYISGLFEGIAGLFLLSPKFKDQGRRIAILLLIAFLPVHIQHVVNGGSQTAHFQFGMGFALVRLGLQFLFLYLAFKLKSGPRNEED